MLTTDTRPLWVSDNALMVMTRHGTPVEQSIAEDLLARRRADKARTTVVDAARHLATCPLQDGMRALERLCVAVAEMDGREKAA